MDQPTNRQRLGYLIDTLAEPFPLENLKRAGKCACGDQSSARSGDALDQTTTKRDAIEQALLMALVKQRSVSAKADSQLTDALDSLSEAQLGQLLKHIPTATVDQHLYDLAVFLQPDRVTTVDEICAWDRKHQHDFTNK